PAAPAPTRRQGAMFERGGYQDLCIFTGNAHPQLAQDIAAALEMPLGQCEVFEFSNENIFVRSDKKDQPRVPFTARLLANLIETAGADRMLTIDMHAGQIQGFFNIPVD